MVWHWNHPVHSHFACWIQRLCLFKSSFEHPHCTAAWKLMGSHYLFINFILNACIYEVFHLFSMIFMLNQLFLPGFPGFFYDSHAKPIVFTRFSRFFYGFWRMVPAKVLLIIIIMLKPGICKVFFCIFCNVWNRPTPPKCSKPACGNLPAQKSEKKH